MAQNDQTYTFIDDPNHKPTLSGRVTAACLNCRRKKIKCSGEADCQQCQEKGLVCDGPPSRKRPRRDHAQTTVPTAALSSNEHPHFRTDSGAPTRSQPQRPPPRLPQGDSGYGSHEWQTRRTSSIEQLSPAGAPPSSTASPVSSTQGRSYSAHDTSMSGNANYSAASPGSSAFMSPFGYDASVSQYSSPIDTSVTAPSLDDWSGVMNRRRVASYRPGHISLPENPYAAHRASAAVPLGSMEWDRRSSNDWWSSASASAQSSTDLISAAHALEQQAQDLRRQAARRQSVESESMTLRPSSQPQQFAATRNLSMQAAFYDPPQAAPNAFDASAFFRQEGMLLHGETPNVDGRTSWWDNHAGRQATRPSDVPYPTPLQLSHAPDVANNLIGTRMWNNQYARQGAQSAHRMASEEEEEEMEPKPETTGYR
ncbi:hypothetical protein LTR08_002218 [Meristemomyces frigidus]|nr:hypothetical protein LTR08_002218 [Meristemomyces frigidus]